MLEVETWWIKPGGSRPHDFWIDGLVRNTSGHRLSDVRLFFQVKTASGKLLGESEASIKLTILLPNQECPFAAQVSVHDRRMSKLILAHVTAGMVDDTVMLSAIPFSTTKKSASFAEVRRRDRKPQ